jgi:hypothetical protein
MRVHKQYFQSKMVLDIFKVVEDMDKAKKEEEDTDLKEKVIAASIDQPVDRMKQIDQLVTLTMAIQNPGLTNQKLNVIIVKR